MADIQLARAYVELIPVTKGISKRAQEAVFPGTAPAEEAAKRSGNAFTGRLGSLLKKSAIGVGVAAGGVLATSLVKGFGRLSAIETAEAKLTGLGNSAQDVAAIMDNALGAVKGTAFGMDEAATTAASAVAAGIKPGQELESYLRLVGDAATIAGTDMSSMGSIFNKVATSGKVQGDVFAQLGDSGIPIVTLLAEQLGVTAAEVYKMGAAGEIGTEDFLAAMSSMSGAALEGGNTTTGAFKNMGAALGRFGAELLSGVYPLIGPFFTAITGAIDQATSAVGPMIERITPGLQAVAGAALETMTAVIGSIGGIVEVIRSGDFNPANWADGVEEDSPLVGFAFRVRDVWQGVLVPFGNWIKSAWPGIVGVLGGVGASLGIAKLGAVAGPVFAALSSGAGALTMAFGNGGLAGAFALVSAKIGKALPVVAKFAPLLRVMFGPLGLIVTSLGYLIATNEEVRASFMELGLVLLESVGTIAAAVGPAIGQVVEAIVPVAGAIAVALGDALTAAAPVVAWLAGALADLISWLQPVLPLIIGIGGAVFAGVKIFGVIMPIISGIIGTIGSIAGAIGGLVSGIGTAIGVIKGLAVAFTAVTGPIGWIILGVGALAAALWAFFTKTETGRAMWANIWGGIKSAVAAVVDWITGVAWPAIQGAWDGIVAGAMWLWQNGIQPAWNGIRLAIAAVSDWITGTLWPAIQTAWAAIGAVAMWLWQSIIVPAWTGIKTAIAVVVTAVALYIDLLKWYFDTVIAPVALWLWRSIMLPAWNGIKAAIGAVVGWFRDTAWPVLKAAFDAVAAGVMWLWRNGIQPAWNGIKSAIGAVVSWFRDVAWPILQTVIAWVRARFDQLRAALAIVWAAIRTAIGTVVGWFRDTAWAIISTVIGWMRMSFEGWKIIAAAVWAGVRSAINAVVGWFRDTAWPAILGVIERLKAGFRGMRDAVRKVWDEVKNRIIQPVATWFRDTIQPLFERVTDGVGDAFDLLKRTVEKAWNGIRDTAKAPVKFLVETIIRDNIIKKYNSVANGVFGLDKVDEGRFTVGWSSGGYTGPGSKYTPAGVVHADEYVIRKESQNSIRNAAPGFLDSLNRYGARALEGLGYAGGGLVKFGSPFRGSYRRGDGFGARGGRHKGIDWPIPSGTVLNAVAGGSVRHTRNAAAGNKLELSIGNGLVAGYHHLSSFIAGNGATVSGGEAVGRVGSTGRSSGPHLHFSLKRDGRYVDPAPYLGAGGDAGSGDGGGFWNPFEGLWDSLKDKVREGVGSSVFGDMLFEVPKKVLGGAVNWAAEKLSAIGDWGAEAAQGVTGRARWTPVATRALAMTGNSGPRNLASLLNRMGKESGFDPRAVNNWDSNARRGTPSKGLMQVIDPTFRAYRDDRAPNDIFNPLANILASIHYTLARYGSLRKGWDRSGGYADGGLVAGLFDNGGWLEPGQVGVNLSSRPEPVFTGAQWDLLARGFDERAQAGRGDIHITVENREGDDPTTFGRRIGEALELELLSLEGF